MADTPPRSLHSRKNCTAIGKNELRLPPICMNAGLSGAPASGGADSPPPGSRSPSVYVWYRTDGSATLGAYTESVAQHGYTEMNPTDVVIYNSLWKNNAAFLGSTAQVTVKSPTLVLPRRGARNAEDLRAVGGLHDRQGISAAAVTVDVRNSRYQRRQADIVRASKNLSEWKKYLPADCVKAMVASGWHFTV